MIPAAPKLRFPEFKDPWKPGHAGDAFKNSRAKGAAGLPIYSVTMDRGLVRRDSMDRHMAADAADGQNLRAQRGDVVYNMMRMWQGAVGLAPEECMVSPAYVVLSPKKHTSPQFFDQWFKGKRMLYLLGAYSHGITSDRLRLYADDFARIPLHLPSLPEQQKIAAFLGAVDAKLAALAAKQAALVRFKAGLMQKLFSQQLRFTRDDGQGFPDWEEKRLGDIVDYEQPTKYLVSSTDYSDDFTTPVLTAGKTLILGYTDETHGIYNGPLPVIIFDDFTTASKFVDFPFKAKSSAMKILRPRSDDVKIKLVFEFLQMMNFSPDSHQRHWISRFSEMQVLFPCPDEQQKIANALSAMDTKIQAVADQVTSLQTFKKGLLQQMFV